MLSTPESVPSLWLLLLRLCTGLSFWYLRSTDSGESRLAAEDEGDADSGGELRTLFRSLVDGELWPLVRLMLRSSFGVDGKGLLASRECRNELVC